ncbi:MAG: AMP-binding protein, partial [Chloroflexi bacterium]|nr:AMP-binding protein [Chloroflexota bacterium]
MTYFGLSPAYIAACLNAGLKPNEKHDLTKLRGIGSTGAPLPVSAFEWLYNFVHDDFALESLSGGTDLCTAFVGGCRLKPVYAGEIQGASLGAKVEAWNNSGEPIVGEVGELVIAAPMPSMPVKFWNDADGARYRASYFEQFPGAWRHGDWIQFNERGGCVIYGRSDATINRKGIRMGTSEIYACVEAIEGVLDSLVVDLELLGRDSFMPLFVILADGLMLDDRLRQTINHSLRKTLSPRHVPDAIYQVTEIPYTLSGKKLEIPVRRILLGHPVEKAANLGAMRNPESIQFFIRLAQALTE